MSLRVTKIKGKPFDDELASLKSIYIAYFPALDTRLDHKKKIQFHHSCQIQFVNVSYYGYNRLQVGFTLLKRINVIAHFHQLTAI